MAVSRKNDLYAAILAGGSGTRFWPLSRKNRPKQFLNIAGRRSLLRQTVERVRPLIPASHIYIVTNKQYAAAVRHQLKGYRIPAGNILPEPEAKNTAPAVAWAAARIHSRNPRAVVSVLPSDHLIKYPVQFRRCLRQAVKLAAQDYLVTMGVVPTRPETGYGYLKTKRKKTREGSVIVVERFVEKPDRAKASRFLKSNRYFWNSGMFVWKAEVILEQFRRFQPAIYKAFRDNHSLAHVRSVWSKLPAVSVDCGILERARNIAAVPAQGIGWSDLGSWESLYQELAGAKKTAVTEGDVLAIDSRDIFIRGQKKLIAAVEVDNLVIVDTPDALLVCRKDASQRVRAVIEQLKRAKRRRLL